MKKIILLLIGVIGLFAFSGCNKVTAGHVGVKVKLLGSDKGIDNQQEVLSPGRYWIGWNEELHVFPTFTQNYVWTKDSHEGSKSDESITFQSTEGLTVGADIGISFHIPSSQVINAFQKYRRGIDEITDVYLRNIVRDSFNKIAAKYSVESAYGSGKSELLDKVMEDVRSQVSPMILIEKISFVGSLRLPEAVTKALNRKIEATQKAEQRENELRETEAEAKKVVAQAQGESKAILLKAKAQAEANKILAKSLTRELVEMNKINKWNGELPRITGNSGALISMKDPL